MRGVKLTVTLEYSFGSVGDEWTVKELRERTLKEAKRAADEFCGAWRTKHHLKAHVEALGVPVCEIGPDPTP